MLFLLTLTVLMLILFYELYWKRRNYPPGPIPLPIFGNLLEIAKAPPGYEAFRKWRKDHGSVFTFWLSFKPIVVIADFDQMRETIVKDGDKFTDRFSFEDFNRFIRGGLYGILTSNGEIWREQRRFTLHTLRDFGMGRNLMETRIMDEVDDLLDRMDRLKNDLNVQKEFGVSVGSVINSVLFGYRFDEQHLHEFHFVKKAIHQILAAEANPFFLVGVAFPSLRGFPGIKGVHQKNHENLNVLFEFIGRQIEERKKTIDFETEDYEDFVECYVKEQIKKKGKENEEFYCNDQLKNLVLDMWVAGMETTSNALNWAICYILNHPEVQEKIHEEFDRVIDSDRKITTNDKNLLPYLNAVVSEVLRFANLLPQNLMRVTVEDTIIAKHLVKKGTAVMPQIGTILYDEKIFPNPHQFNPDRFINADGSYKNYPELIPFSLGKRQCVGEGLARMELYLFIANIFQRFKITANKKPSMEKKMGLVVTANEYLCNVQRRH